MSKSVATKAVQTTADKAEELGKHEVIAQATRDDARRINAAGKRFGTLVDEVARNVHMAYMTGYVHTERTSKDNPLPLGSIRQNDYAKLFQSPSNPDLNVTATTVKRWRIFGAAQAAGLATDSPEYKALKASKMADKVAEHVLSPKATPESIAKAIEDAKAEATASREAQTPELESSPATVTEVQALVSIAGGIKLESLTPDEIVATLDAVTVLVAKVEAYHKAHAVKSA